MSTILHLLYPNEVLDWVRVASAFMASCSTVLAALCWPAWRAASVQVRLLGNGLLVGVIATGIGSVDQIVRDVPGGLSTLTLMAFQMCALAAWGALWRAQHRFRRSTP